MSELALEGGSGKKPDRKARWPHGESVPKSWVQDAKDTLPSLEKRGYGHADVEVETILFLNWARSSGKTYLDWELVYRNWIIRAAQKAPRPRKY